MHQENKTCQIHNFKTNFRAKENSVSYGMAKLSHHSLYKDTYKFLFNCFFFTSYFIVNMSASKPSIFELAISH